MREINFRIWFANKFTYIGDLNQIKTFNFNLKNSVNISPIWQECTNSKDKNGKTIYEGDIVRFIMGTLESRYIVRFGEFTTNSITANGFYLKSTSTRNDSYPMSLGAGIERFEVIGNVLENPELMMSL